MYWSRSRVFRAGACSDKDKIGRLYVYLKDESYSPPKHENYFQMESSVANQMLATALTALSLDLPVCVLVGGKEKPDSPDDPLDPENYYYCYRMYVTRLKNEDCGVKEVL